MDKIFSSAKQPTTDFAHVRVVQQRLKSNIFFILARHSKMTFEIECQERIVYCHLREQADFCPSVTTNYIETPNGLKLLRSDTKRNNI